MAWNEPGKGDKKDPWGNGGNQQPPDLDEIFKKLQQKLAAAFGGGGGGGSRNSGSSSLASGGLSFVLAILAVLYILSGIYIVRPAEQAVIFLFGEYQSTVGPGPHWIARFIQSKTIVNVDEVATSRHEAHMLTKDENIVSVELGVQYKIGDIENYLFNVSNPELTLEQVTDSAVRQVIGHSTLDDILTSGRERIRQLIKEEIIRILAEYKAGLHIVDVPMQPAKAPEAVKEAFDDAIKAQEDEQRSINRARAYEKQRVPIAEGQAQRRVTEAEAYKRNVVLQAQGDTDRFLKVLPQFELAPTVTRERLYLDTMAEVYSKSSKILVDAKGSNNLFYLPLDKLLERSREAAAQAKYSDMASNLPSLAEGSAKDAVHKATNSLARNSHRWNGVDSRSSRDSYTR